MIHLASLASSHPAPLQSDPQPAMPEPLVSQFASDPEMAEIVAIFVAEVPDRIRSLRVAWAAGDRRQIRTLVHQMKGAAGGYGFPVVGEAAAALEKAVADPRHTQDATALAACRDAFEHFLGLLARIARAG